MTGDRSSAHAKVNQGKDNGELERKCVVAERDHLRNCANLVSGLRWRRQGRSRGLMSRVDYLKWLGIDAVWLTPIYRSPFRDLGYDISDYCSVDPAFGGLEQFARLLKAMHGSGIRLILDLVPYHTANNRSWF